MAFEGVDLLVAAILGGILVAFVLGKGISDLRGSFDELREENSRLQCRIETLEQERETQSRLIIDLRTDLIVWKARYNDLESKLARATGGAGRGPNGETAGPG